MAKTIQDIAEIILHDRNSSAYRNEQFFVEGLPAPLGIIELIREILRRLQNAVTPDGSETIINAGDNVTVSGTGTAEDPYIIMAAAGGSEADGSETIINAGANVTITGTGTAGNPYVITASGGSADGSETIINAGANVTVTGSGTAGDPYVVAAAGGGASVAHDSLTSGNLSVASSRVGGSATVLSNPSAGEYTLTVQAGAHVLNATITGNNTTLNASQEIVLNINNTANSRNRRFVVQLYDAANGALVDQQLTGTVHTQAVAGNITTITIPGLNGFGATGYIIEIR